MPQATGVALIGIQIPYRAHFLDMPDHIPGLFKRIVYGLITRRSDRIKRPGIRSFV